MLVWRDTAGAVTQYLVVDSPIGSGADDTIGILEETGADGNIKPVAMLGAISRALSGLQVGATYYVDDTDGSLTTTPTRYPIGIAIETDELFVFRGADWGN
jgi:hypothetical protein